ncbi:hypothetical protein PR048_023858 [Dryococelus australis]|uniref:Secreted protein n=1 Tax=Dryococelus australis TaxID=614101 RepID=A0ABQ9GV79_9NEOP|nr:hypothetical protein PR048_023858 [Dryococelus australis]
MVCVCRHGAVVLWAWLLCAEGHERDNCAVALPAASSSNDFNVIQYVRGDCNCWGQVRAAVEIYHYRPAA